ncbi:AraC family transcriptional regulator [Paenibacillus sp. 481]|uniref:AraC family transcriptional regulator n=1 Tax=Paenibacillus sp. 481 TaxID=2835869 RepID=UPI001E4FF144|nr:AraC family transcriptional regulator [Paenibacillus sp. 481]UHA73342.1 AraC family transcriptional regulator [Paenibacillus sp. 481]
MPYERKIQSVLDYIETHVQDDIACESLVELTGFSKSHFLRVFEAYTGYTVMSYVRFRKLHLAAEQVSQSKDTIANIAYDYGFESHDVFGRAFKRAYGITPENYRRRRFLLPAFHAVNLAQQRKGGVTLVKNTPEVSIVTKLAMKLIGIECRIEDGSASPTDLWKQYFDNWKAMFGSIEHLRVEPEKEMDYALSVDQDESGFTYFIGIEVTSVVHVPPGTVARIIPKTKYARFTAVGPVGESIGRTYNYIFRDWFPSSSFQTASGPIMEHYDLRCATHLGIPPELHEMDIYIPIESVITETKEIVELQPYQAAYYKAAGRKGRRWYQVKQEAFDVMIAWALSQGFAPSDLRIRANNNGGAPEEDFFYEVHMDVTGQDVSITVDLRIKLIDCDGGLYIVTPTLHRMLEPTGKAFCKWFEQQETYIRTRKGFEEFIIQDGKVKLDTLVRIHFGANCCEDVPR